MNKMKNIQQMEELLQEFYDGTTTADEERALQKFLSSAECPEDWEVHRTVLNTLSTPDAVPVPDGLAERIAASIRPRRALTLRRILSASAAAAAIIFGLILFSQPEEPIYTDTCATPEEAAAELDRAFMMLSQAMNQGLNIE